MPKATDTAVLTSMRILREGAGLSQREVARRIGMSGEAYRKKELGLMGVTSSDLARLAAVYEKSITEAFPEYEPNEGEAALIEDMGAA